MAHKNYLKDVSSAAKQRAYNKEKKDAHHWIYIEFASRRAHANNVDARRDFFLADVICHATQWGLQPLSS